MSEHELSERATRVKTLVVFTRSTGLYTEKFRFTDKQDLGVRFTSCSFKWKHGGDVGHGFSLSSHDTQSVDDH